MEDMYTSSGPCKQLLLDNFSFIQGGKPAANASLLGGETEALRKLKNFAAECQAKPSNKDGKKENIYGANFSCKISPWLAVGCLSPRYIFDEVEKTMRCTFLPSCALFCLPFLLFNISASTCDNICNS